MVGRLDGNRHGHADIDPEGIRRRLGERIRDLRIDAGMRLQDVADAMKSAGFAWTKDTVTILQTGRGRQLYATEALALARLFDITVDDLLTGAVGEPAIETPETVPALGSRKVKWVTEWPQFSGYPGQLEEVEQLARDVGVPRNEMVRRLMHLGVAVLKRQQ